jgi:hypothetical protein
MRTPNALLLVRNEWVVLSDHRSRVSHLRGCFALATLHAVHFVSHLGLEGARRR